MFINTLAVDASYLLKRSIHGAKDLHTNEFGHIGGLFQFYMKLRQLIQKYKINKVILFWDGENGGLYRHLIDPAYKANRKDKEWSQKIQLSPSQFKKEEEKDKSILKQRKRIQSYAEELFIRQIEIHKIEADDLIASYCMDNNEDENIFLYTNDRDFCQLLDYNITILFDNISTPIDKNNFFFHFNYHYHSALTMKIISGDPADNIKGIDGVKETTLMKYFPEIKIRKMGLREVCKLSKKLNEDRVANKKKPLKALENILNGTERLKTNYKLTNLAEPLLNDEAIEELESLTAPLSPKGRDSKYLYRLMMEDGFLTNFSSNFTSFVQPFYPIIMTEKKIYQDYVKENK